MADLDISRPSEWNDDQRMTVMFSPFRNREVNPKSYEKKLEFWRELICNECRRQNVVSFNTSQLPKMFERKGKYPHCLSTVINDMISKGKIMKFEDFQQTGKAGWLSWGFNWLVKKPVSWTYRSLTKTESPNAHGDYVMLDLLQEKSDEVLQRLQKSSSSVDVIEYKSLPPVICDICKEETTVELVLIQLQKDHKITISLTDKGDKVIKFVTSNKNKVEALTETEMKIHRLKSVVPKLEEQMKQLMEEMQRCRLDAKHFLKQGLKNSAKNSLRRKRVLEKVLHKRENALENIHVLIQQIKDTDTNKMILDAYAAGTSAYKEKVKEMTPDHIDDVMIGIQETLDMQSEINSAMSQSIEHPDDVPISELEEELDAILAAEAGSDAAAGDQAASPDMDNLLQGLGGLTLESIGSSQFPEVPKFDPSVPPPVTPPRQADGLRNPHMSPYAETTPTRAPYSPYTPPQSHSPYSPLQQLSLSDIQLPTPPKTLYDEDCVTGKDDHGVDRSKYISAEHS